jgi:hypothetical protein
MIPSEKGGDCSKTRLARDSRERRGEKSWVFIVERIKEGNIMDLILSSIPIV